MKQWIWIFLAISTALCNPLTIAWGADRITPTGSSKEATQISEGERQEATIQPELQWIDANGASVPLPFRYEGTWFLSSEASDLHPSGIRRPVYQLHLHSPENLAFELIESEEADPQFTSKIHESGAILSLRRKLGRYRIRMAGGSAGKERASVIEGSLIVRFTPEKPSLWTLNQCEKLGWRWDFAVPPIKEKGAAAVPLFLGIAECQVTPEGKFSGIVFWSPETTLISVTESGTGKTTEAVSRVTATGTEAAKVEFSKGIDVQMLERRGANEVSALRWGARADVNAATSRLTATAGAGVSTLFYSEEPLAISKTFLALTVKGGVSYWLLPDHWDLAASSYFSGSPVSLYSGVGSSDQPNAHFYGINFRTGYQITPDQHGLGAWQLKFSVGYYFWGMITPPLTYGVNLVTGPQVFVSVGSPSGGRPWGAYIKLAPISDDPLAASLRSRELAMGGSIGVPWFGEKVPGFVALDLAQTEMRFTQAVNVIGLTSISLSVGRGF